jgi:AcrR family transcriptional regulator
MQRIDEAKRQAILKAAEELFAARPFHEVHLDDVASAARVGKGTLYIYFQSKDDLYLSVIEGGFRRLVDRLRPEVHREDGSDAWQTLELIVRELVGWAMQHPKLFELMRSAERGEPRSGIVQTRQELTKMIESVIRRGIREGAMQDPHPELTAQFIPAAVRAAVRWEADRIGREVLSRHVLRLLGHGIRRSA